jgi:uncharacterized SAM-binding protein YcdF (DUF218 family)
MDSVFFIISKVAWALLSPTNVLMGLVIIATLCLYFNKVLTAKLILGLISLIGFILIAYPMSDWVMSPLESRFSKPEVMPSHIDGIIMLGGSESLAVSLSWNTVEVGEAADRYIAMADLATHYPSAPVIFTGGSGLVSLQDSGKEGDLATTLLQSVGIDKSRFIIESESRNTYENFLLVKSKLPKLSGQYILITSAFHMARSVGIARNQGVNVIPYPVDFRTRHAEMRQFDFDLFAHLSVLEPAWREWIGLTVYYLNGKTSSWFPKQIQQPISSHSRHAVNLPPFINSGEPNAG